MASNYSEPVPVILRVKRKREEGPADTLGKPETEGCKETNITNSHCLFPVVPKVAKLDPSLCDPAGMF